MSAPHERFALNSEDVAAKIIDGELIIIRLSDGTYYATDNVGACLWQLIESGLPLSDMVRSVASWYGAPDAQVEADVRTLVSELLSEHLIVPQTNGDASAVAVEPPAGPLTYASPRLNVYRDMGNLLALDPPTPGIDDLLFRDPSSD